MILAVIALFGMVWGSFLNVVAYRLMNNQSIVMPRSRCNYCKKTIAWHDNIPLFSWIFLSGKCRYCRKNISWLYPFIELITALALICLYLFVPEAYFFAYFIFCSALIVTIRTDIEYMLIIPELCFYLIPVACLLSYKSLLPISLSNSILGSLFGYAILWSLAKIFQIMTKKDGIGSGDFDLLALIGAFTGIEGIMSTLCIGSWIGSIVGITYLLISAQKRAECRLPFAPFLSIGAFIYICLQNSIHFYFFMA